MIGADLYIPPGAGKNDTPFYELPDIDTILVHIRLCGCDIVKFQEEYIPDVNHHREVFVRILEQINADESLRKKYDDMRSASKEAALTEAEDNLMRMTKPGGKDTFKATSMVLTTLSERWKTKKDEKPVITDADRLAKELEEAVD